MSAKSIVRQALVNYTDLTNIVPVERIMPAWHDESLGYPQVTYNRVSPESTAYSGDNASYKFTTTIQIDIWDNSGARASTVEDEVKNAIRNTLLENQYGSIRTVEDNFEENEKIYNLKLDVTIHELG